MRNNLKLNTFWLFRIINLEVHWNIMEKQK